MSVALALPLNVWGLTITFNLRDADAPDDVASGSFTRGGITATLAANSGTLNQTSSWYGVNATGTGDDTDQIDDGAGIAESISISFDSDVYFTQIVLASLSDSAGDQAALSLAGTLQPVLTDTGSALDTFDFSSGNLIGAGQLINLGWQAGNGFSLESFSMTKAMKSSSVSDVGSSLLFVAIALPALVAIRQLKRFKF